MKYSNVLDNCHTIKAAAETVTNGTSHFSSEELAGEYMFDAATDGGDDELDSVTENDLEAHGEFLVEAGAQFDMQKALSHAAAMLAEAKRDLHSSDV